MLGLLEWNIIPYMYDPLFVTASGLSGGRGTKESDIDVVVYKKQQLKVTVNVQTQPPASNNGLEKY